MTLYQDINEHINKDGTKTTTIVPWTKSNFEFAISNLEATVTNRRLREAVMTDEGAAWLADVNEQIEVLRTAMNSLS